MHADKAKQNFYRTGGDMFMLLNIWEQWSEANYSQSFVLISFKATPFSYISADGVTKTMFSSRHYPELVTSETSWPDSVIVLRSFQRQMRTRTTLPLFKRLLWQAFSIALYVSLCISSRRVSDRCWNRPSSKRVVTPIEQLRVIKQFIFIRHPVYSTVSLQ
jgi:hypothetical protein